MNTKIQKFNQFLLERYPTTWNTKILSIVGISLVVHLLFFIIGFTCYNPLDNEYDYSFGIGLGFLNVILSILILLYWIISLSKNNAFKDYYPTSANKLFVHFLHYFVIVFFATTFYISHQIGIASYANTTLFEEELDNEIEQVNKAAIFFSMDKGHYTGTNKPDEISYYNYSRTFINPNWDSAKMNRYVTDLLDSPDHKEKITKILSDFLKIAKKYDIQTNLTVEDWLHVVYSDEETLFGVNSLIADSHYSNGSYNSSTLYFYSYGLRSSLHRQQNLFNKFNYVLYSFHYFIWLSLIFAMLIFIIRTTSLRLFLLSLVTAALISIGIGLLLLLIGVNSSGGDEEYLLILPIFVCLLILVLPYFTLNDKSDKISGIIINIGFPAFPLFILFLGIYIASIFNELRRSIRVYVRGFDDNFVLTLTSLAFFSVIIIFIYSRCFIIKKWKGLPEG